MQKIIHNWLNSLKKALIVVSPDHNIVYFNTVAAEFYGWSRNVIGSYYLDSELYKCAPQKIPGLDSVKRIGFVSFEQAIVADETKPRTAVTYLRWSIWYFENLGFVICMKDDTDNVLSKMTLRNIFQNAPVSMYWKDAAGRYMDCNKYVLEMAGVSKREDIIGKTDAELPWKDWLNDIRAVDERVLSAKEPCIFEEVGKLADGHVVTLHSSKVPLRDDSDNVYGIFGFSFDITERKLAEEELRVAKERAELASEVKSQFIQNMEHDLRTPASGVAQMLEILAAAEPNHERKETLQKVARAAKRLLDVLNDITAFDMVDSRCTPVLLHRFDLYDVVQGIIEMEAPVVQNKNLVFKVNIDSNVPKIIVGDKQRISRILLNLVGNAVKFTHDGSVEVNVSVVRKIGPKNLLLQLVVKDTGIGIPLNKIDRIYERFERCTPTAAGVYPGFGLGLSITKQFIDDLHGEIEVESIEGQGATFTCLLPCSLSLLDMTNYDGVFDNLREAATAEAALTGVSEPDLELQEPEIQQCLDFSKVKVLLVEDDEIAQLLARDIFIEQLHTEFHFVGTGRDALSVSSVNEYDIVFLDIGLPDILGIRVVREMREAGRIMPIIALTAHDNIAMRDECKLAGFDGFLVKPLNIAKACAILAKYVTKQKLQESALLDEHPKVDEKKILDFITCKKIVGNDAAVQQVWQVFVDLLPKYEQDMAKCFIEQDIKGLYALCHKLKGAASCAIAPKLMVAAAKMCEATRDISSYDESIDDLYSEVCAAIVDVKDEYRRLGY